jgi:hypothetical protein
MTILRIVILSLEIFLLFCVYCCLLLSLLLLFCYVMFLVLLLLFELIEMLRIVGISWISNCIRARLQEPGSLRHSNSVYSGKTARCTRRRHLDHSIPPAQRLPERTQRPSGGGDGCRMWFVNWWALGGTRDESGRVSESPSCHMANRDGSI